MAAPRKIRPRKRFQRARFGRKRGMQNPKQRVAIAKRNQVRRTRGR